MVNAVARKKARDLQQQLVINHVAAQGDSNAVKKTMRSIDVKKRTELPQELLDQAPMEDKEIDAFIERMQKNESV